MLVIDAGLDAGVDQEGRRAVLVGLVGLVEHRENL